MKHTCITRDEAIEQAKYDLVALPAAISQYRALGGHRTETVDSLKARQEGIQECKRRLEAVKAFLASEGVQS